MGMYQYLYAAGLTNTVTQAQKHVGNASCVWFLMYKIQVYPQLGSS